MLNMRGDMIHYLKRRQIALFEVGGLDPHLEDLAKKVDVFYVTQIPVGSFGDRLDDYEKSKKDFVIDKKIMKNMKRNSILMHPLPRGGEINPEVDRDLRKVYYKQIHYGICIRMAILCAVLGKV